MTKKWICTYLAVLAIGSMGCMIDLGGGYEDDDYSYEYDDYSYEDYDYYDEDATWEESDYYADDDGYHGRDAVRQALTAEAPAVPNDDGYDEYNTWGGCQVHAECPQGQVCASDPACPDFLYCYEIDEAGCDCDDRFNTVCFFGQCVLRGVDCDGGCPDGTLCDSTVGACMCNDSSCAPTDAPTAVAPPEEGPKCLNDFDCADGLTCIDGECGAVVCWVDSDCGAGQVCASATDGTYYCVIP